MKSYLCCLVCFICGYIVKAQCKSIVKAIVLYILIVSVYELFVYILDGISEEARRRRYNPEPLDNQ
jgi:hypothetical protein